MPATKKEIDQAELLSRYIINETTEYEYDSERQTPNYLAENYPVTLNFYPQQDIMNKLIKRMTQVKDVDEEIWQGFHKD